MELAVCAEMVFLELPVTERVRRIDELGFQVEIWGWTARACPSSRPTRSPGRCGSPPAAPWTGSNASGPPSPPQRPDAARRLLAGRGPEVGHVDPDRVEHDPDP